MILIIDEEVQGERKNFSNVNNLKAKIIECIDETVESVTIKKRVAHSNSQNDDSKGDF